MATVTGGLCRVTIVAPSTRVDLALPTEVPLADLVPTLLRYAGEDLTENGSGHGGWSLSRLGSGQLDTTRSCSDLGIRDGEQLYFTPRDAAPEEAVFDDVVDAIASAHRGRSGRWTDRSSRTFGLATGVGGLVLGLLVILLSGPPQLPGSIAAGLIALALLGTGTALSRAYADSRAGALIGGFALPYGFVAGLLALGGSRGLLGLGAPHVLVGFAVLTVLGVLVTLAVADAVPLFFALTCTGLIGTLATAADVLTQGQVGAAGVASAAAAFALGAAPALPMLAFRLARLPMPMIPTGPDDLRAENEQVPGQQVLLRSRLADEYLSGLLVGTGIVVGVAELLMVLDRSVFSIALVSVVSVAVLLRARTFPSVRQRLPLLLAGLAGLASLALGITLTTDPLIRLLGVGGGVLVCVLVALLGGLAIPGRRFSPFWSRALDIVEIILVIAIVPLMVGVLGLYDLVRSLGG